MSQKESILFIVNPVSGAKNSEDKPQIIRDNIDKDRFDFDIVLTKDKGHAIELSEQGVIDGYDHIVAVGGDGTVNEVAQSLVHTETSLGIIPGGSGNGFAMHIGMGRDTAKAVKKINTAQPQTIDSCTINDSFFLNLAGIGFDALIAYKAENGIRRGLQMYVKIVSQEMWNFKAENFKIILNDEIIDGAFTTVVVANASMYGYNFTVAPKASLTDGLFDIIFIKEASILRTLGASWRMLNKTIDRSPLVESRHSDTVKIITEKPYYFHVDGESHTFEGELVLKLIPKSIKVLFPI